MTGINRDKTYNQGGQENKDNWKLRINPDYEKTYHESLVTNEEPAMNMPELLSLAVNSKMGIPISKEEKTEEEAKNEAGNLLDRLAYWEGVLKESEEDLKEKEEDKKEIK